LVILNEGLPLVTSAICTEKSFANEKEPLRFSQYLLSCLAMHGHQSTNQRI
jgi:hypothetical protein